MIDNTIAKEIEAIKFKISDYYKISRQCAGNTENISNIFGLCEAQHKMIKVLQQAVIELQKKDD